MVNKLTRKAIISIGKNINMYTAEMAKLKEKISAIDEKYRKMAEEARKDLAAEYKQLENEQEMWQDALKRYDSSDVNEVLGNMDNEELEEDGPEETPDAEKEEAEEVTDDLFPENNSQSSSVEDDKPEELQKAEEVAEEPENAPEFDGAGFTEADNEPTESTPENDLNDLWPSYEETAETPVPEEAAEESPEAEESAVPEEPKPEVETMGEIGIGIDPDEFPAFPEEW